MSASAQVHAHMSDLVEAQLLWRPWPAAEAQASELCEQIGVWPLPKSHTARVQALEIFASRALPFFNAGSTDEDDQHNFQRWLHAIDSGDHVGARAGAVLLRFWSRADSRSLANP